LALIKADFTFLRYLFPYTGNMVLFAILVMFPLKNANTQYNK